MDTLETASVTELPGPHLEPHEVARYVDGAAELLERSRIELHLVSCDECRAEVAELSLMAAALRRHRQRKWLWISAGATAAAAILVMLSPASLTRTSELREGPLTTAISPRPLAPIGIVDSLAAITWSSVPEANRYELRIFDSLGTVLWQHETNDTSVHVSPTLRLRNAVPYYWRVEATTGFGRATHSELIGFSLRRDRVP